MNLLRHHATLAHIQDLADDAIIAIDHEQLIVLFNRGAEKMFDYPACEVISRPLDILLPEGLAALHRKHIETFGHSPVLSRRMSERSKVAGRRKDGTEFPAEASIAKVVVDGRNIFTVLMRDTTERMLVEDRLRASLREKEVLVKEIHHRVKNNLQVVSSLLGLQARSVADPLTRRKFEESQSRIQSLAMLHEGLYLSDNFVEVDVSDYIPRMAEPLFQSFAVGDRVHIRFGLDALRLHMDTAMPCGLIITELLSNSLKYAFPEGRCGEIAIEMRVARAGSVRLVVTDDGVGMPAGFDWRRGSTLGLRLVRALAEQLSAGVVLVANPGVSFAFDFPYAG
jgi:PAS domain S-box-containing protein